MSNTMYVIMVVVLLWYTALLLVGLCMAAREAKKEVQLYKFVLNHVIQELKDIIIKEEKSMLEDKGNYKNRNKSEPINFKPEPVSLSEDSKLTISDLVTTQPTDQDYEEVEKMLAKLARQTFDLYNFLIAKSSNEKEESHFLQLVSHFSEDPELHKAIFKKAVETNIDIPTLQKRFGERVARGEVLPLGSDIVVITDDGTGQPPTGCSPINRGLEGGEIAFIVSFVKKEHHAAWLEHTFKDNEGSE
ncbi:hypothetical protein P59_052 [Bacillus phage P59]|nr:hypothetical protein P59_052 [Bacillus phage P59]